MADTQTDGRERVALDLAIRIMEREGTSNFTSRATMLDLYVECLAAVFDRRKGTRAT